MLDDNNGRPHQKKIAIYIYKRVTNKKKEMQKRKREERAKNYRKFARDIHLSTAYGTFCV